MKTAKPIYEWCWTRPNGSTLTTRSTKRAGTYKRFAERLGGNIERRTIGMRLPFSLEELVAH